MNYMSQAIIFKRQIVCWNKCQNSQKIHFVSQEMSQGHLSQGHLSQGTHFVCQQMSQGLMSQGIHFVCLQKSQGSLS